MNVRLVYPKNLSEATEEISKIESNVNAIQLLASKAVHICMLIESVSYLDANAIAQAILGCHGEAVISKESANCLVAKVNVLIMGNFDQINKMCMSLRLQSETLTDVCFEVEHVLKMFEKREKSYYCCGKYKLEIGKKTYIMGILNVTNDSFSGDGLLAGVSNTSLNKVTGGLSSEVSCRSCSVKDKEMIIDAACRQAEIMVANGADIIDVGGESTRPGHTPVDAKAELDRVLGVVEKLVKTLNVPISVDTSKLYVAENVLKAGAHIINDVHGLIKEPKIAEVAASYGAGVVAMHNAPIHGDVIGCITKFLRKSVDIALNAGLKHENIILDPGIGFEKNVEQNLEVMRRLDELKCLGYPILLGTSRKYMLGHILGLPVDERIEGTAATVTLGIAKGIDFTRVHDVKEMSKVAKTSDAMIRGL
ncbi:MAG: dihydropteroate synthase [Candidatus Bathyarchaeota archaeon]|nr:dihydropteroate synthase [Candidatus Termiticorpusculum sp.]